MRKTLATVMVDGRHEKDGQIAWAFGKSAQTFHPWLLPLEDLPCFSANQQLVRGFEQA